MRMPYGNFNCISKSEVNFIKKNLILWEQHSTWAGMAITSIVVNYHHFRSGWLPLILTNLQK